MKNEVEYDFIASAKVIRYKINPKAADILATLIYKYRHWKKKGKLANYYGKIGFYISIDDIIEETTFGKSTIQKNIKLLEKEGLLESKQQGLTKPNVYYLDEDKITKYIVDHEEEYKKYRLEVRNRKTSVALKNSLKDENTTSRKGNSSFLEHNETNNLAV